jgi:predicted extracellular nuclease
LSASHTVRVGDTLNGVTGVLEQRFGEYRLQPVGPVAIAAANPRPAGPAAVGGTLRVAGMNVLNYFNGNGQGGGFPTERGATTLEEFARQRAKTVATIVTMDADIIGLSEIENDPAGFSAIEDLVAGRERSHGARHVCIHRQPASSARTRIRVALLYKPARVTPFKHLRAADLGGGFGVHR